MKKIKSKIFISFAILSGLVLVAIAAFLYLFVFRSVEAEVSLEAAVASVASATPTATSLVTQPVETATKEAEDEPTAGDWILSDSQDSFVGYRVDEVLSRLGEFTAVGRTSNIDAVLEFDGAKVLSVTITADLTSLESDNQYRDRALRSQAIETDLFPQAEFKLIDEIEITEDYKTGISLSYEIAGLLTLHGVSREIVITVEGTLVDDVLVIIGSYPVMFADYDIEQPSSRSVVSIEDNGILEFQLFFVKS
ncbi:MAG: YceI family protein [Dehalococcoidia bacterium]|nr:YceI family protein [Dehalococcoidia bacterium]